LFQRLRFKANRKNKVGSGGSLKDNIRHTPQQLQKQLPLWELEEVGLNHQSQEGKRGKRPSPV